MVELRSNEGFPVITYPFADIRGIGLTTLVMENYLSGTNIKMQSFNQQDK